MGYYTIRIADEKIECIDYGVVAMRDGRYYEVFSLGSDTMLSLDHETDGRRSFHLNMKLCN